LSAEIAWLPGISPKRVNAYHILLRHNIDYYLSSSGNENPLIKANLISAAIEFFDSETNAKDWATWIYELACQADQIAPEEVYKVINEDRSVSGFPRISGLSIVETEISERRRNFKDVIKNVIDQLPTNKMIAVMTDVVESATNSGNKHAPILIDELIDSFEIGVRPFLDREAENVRKLVETAHEASTVSEKEVKPILDKLELVVRNWDKVAQPIQLSMKARGLEHEQSRELLYEIRNLSIELCNKKDMLEPAQRVINILREVFAELPEAVDRLDEDVEAIENIFKDRERINHESTEWANEITYQAEIGLMFKDTLSISPSGIEWKGNCLPLDAVTGIGWGRTEGIYLITYCDSQTVTRIETRRENVWSNFVGRLWKTVGVRLLTEMLLGLRDGKKYRIGDAVIDDYGFQLTEHHTFGANKQIYYKWLKICIWSADGYFYVGAVDNKKAYLKLAYQSSNNAHLFEFAINEKINTDSPRLSSLLKME
jgi:hypothetical protein